MKKIFVVVMALAAFVLAPVEMSAQEERPDTTRREGPRMQRMDPQQMLEQRVKQMTERYELSEEQQVKIKALFEEQQKAAQGRMGKPEQGGPQGGQRQEMTQEQRDSLQAVFKAEQEKFDASLQEILTEEQYAKYKEDEAQRRERRQGPSQGGPQGGQPGEGGPQGPAPTEE